MCICIYIDILFSHSSHMQIGWSTLPLLFLVFLFFVIALVWLLLLLWLGLCLFMFVFVLLLLLQPRPLITTTTKSQFNYNSARPIGQPDSGGHKIRRTCPEQTRTDTLGTLCVISLPVRVSVCLQSVSESTSVCACVLMHAYVWVIVHWVVVTSRAWTGWTVTCYCLCRKKSNWRLRARLPFPSQKKKEKNNNKTVQK